MSEPIRNDITQHINAYLIRPTNISSEELKEIYSINKSVNIDINDLRVLLIDWDYEAYQDSDYTRGSIYVIDYGLNNPYLQENQFYPENPWERKLKSLNINIRNLNYITLKESDINILSNYDFSKLDTRQLTGSTFYFEGATDQEIINYIKQIPLSIQLKGEYNNHYTFGYCQHTYLINDVNLFVENHNGDIVQIYK